MIFLSAELKKLKKKKKMINCLGSAPPSVQGSRLDLTNDNRGSAIYLGFSPSRTNEAGLSSNSKASSSRSLNRTMSITSTTSATTIQNKSKPVSSASPKRQIVKKSKNDSITKKS